MDHVDLEQVVDRALKDLPVPRAPHTLLARVMTAVARPWYRRGWSAWPAGWQVVTAAMLLAVVGAGGMVLPLVPAAGMQVLPAPVLASLVPLVDAMRATSTIASTAISLWSSIAQPIFGYAMVLFLAVGMLCAALRVAVCRVALGGACRS